MIVRRSPFSGKTHEMEMMIDPADMNRYENGAGCIQDIFPYLSADEREFLLTGITPKEWSQTFGIEE